MGLDQANRAAMLWPLGRYDEARAALDQAYSIAAEPEAGFKSQLAYVELIGAEMAFSLGKRVEATMRATAALELADRDYKETALQAKQTLALTQSVSGAPKTAAALVEEAVAAARELKVPRLLSTALLASAEVRIAGGDARGALADAQAAQKMFASAAQLESEWRAWLVSARSALLEGNSSTAYDYAARAETSRAALQARWGEDNYQGYVRRPDIQSHLKQLRQLLGAKAIVPGTRGD
jgi:ATP/maltotriose-dependent transcriptional regulator MalT